MSFIKPPSSLDVVKYKESDSRWLQPQNEDNPQGSFLVSPYEPPALTTNIKTLFGVPSIVQAIAGLFLHAYHLLYYTIEPLRGLVTFHILL